MTIYLCIKFQSNTPILSKDIALKPFVLRTGQTYGRDGCTYGQRWYFMPTRPPIENGGGIKTKGELQNGARLLFLNVTCLLNVFYILVKYHENILQGFKVMA